MAKTTEGMRQRVQYIGNGRKVTRIRVKPHGDAPRWMDWDGALFSIRTLGWSADRVEYAMVPGEYVAPYEVAREQYDCARDLFTVVTAAGVPVVGEREPLVAGGW